MESIATIANGSAFKHETKNQIENGNETKQTTKNLPKTEKIERRKMKSGG